MHPGRELSDASALGEEERGLSDDDAWAGQRAAAAKALASSSAEATSSGFICGASTPAASWKRVNPSAFTAGLMASRITARCMSPGTTALSSSSSLPVEWRASTLVDPGQVATGSCKAGHEPDPDRISRRRKHDRDGFVACLASRVMGADGHEQIDGHWDQLGNQG